MNPRRRVSPKGAIAWSAYLGCIGLLHLGGWLVHGMAEARCRPGRCTRSPVLAPFEAAAMEIRDRLGGR